MPTSSSRSTPAAGWDRNAGKGGKTGTWLTNVPRRDGPKRVQVGRRGRDSAATLHRAAWRRGLDPQAIGWRRPGTERPCSRSWPRCRYAAGTEPTCPRPAEDPGIIVITHASSRIGQGSRHAALDWRAALLTGLITSTFSTLVAQLTAAQVG